MNIIFFKNLIQKIIKNDKKVLGRWNMEVCDEKMNKKIDLSNEDHCGPCGQYILEQNKKKVINKEIIIYKNKK